MLGKSVLITGGTGALGSAVTEAVIGRNARVTLSYIDESEKAALQAQLSETERDVVTFVKADIADEAQVTALVEQVPHVDVLLHLVGSQQAGPTEHFSLASFREQIETNLKTTFLICRAVFPKMLENGYGRIVTVASRHAVTPESGFAVHAAAKAGVVAFTKALASEARGHDVTANVVVAGRLDTPENQARYPKDRLVQPAAVAEIMATLGGAISGHLRGAVLEVVG